MYNRYILFEKNIDFYSLLLCNVKNERYFEKAPNIADLWSGVKIILCITKIIMHKYSVFFQKRVEHLQELKIIRIFRKKRCCEIYSGNRLKANMLFVSINCGRKEKF